MRRYNYSVHYKNKRQGVDWTHLAQDRDKWQAVSRKGDETSGSIKRGNFMNPWELIRFSRELFPLELVT
jgi:general stress protein YciG